MKRIILSIMMVTATIVTAFAQEEKPASTQPTSAEISALRTASSLAKYGYANYSATALIEAANIFSSIKTQELEANMTPGSNDPIKAKDNNIMQKLMRATIKPFSTLSRKQNKVLLKQAPEEP